MFPSHKITLEQTLTLTHLRLNTERYAVKYCQNRDYMPEPQIKQKSKKSECITIRACHETLDLIHAHAIFCSQKNRLVQTITLTHLRLNAETCLISYCQDRDYIPEPQIKQTSKHPSASYSEQARG